MADAKCRSCGAEVVWAVHKDARIPLDPAVPVYRIITSLGGTPQIDRCSSVPGMPFVSLADHRTVCRGKKPSARAPREEE